MDAIWTIVISSVITLILGYIAGYKKTQEVKTLIGEAGDVFIELGEVLREWKKALEDDKVTEEEFRVITAQMLELQQQTFEFVAALKAVVQMPIRNGEGMKK